MRQDLRFALRRLLAAPGFTLFAVVSLALGIGSTTALYSVVYAAILRPPAIAAVDRVVNLYHSNPLIAPGLSYIGFSSADYQDLRESQTSFSAITAWTVLRHTAVARGGAEVIFGEAVGGEYFTLHSVEPLHGRLIQRADDHASAAAIAVLSEAFWRKRFDADPSVIGTTITIGGHPCEIVGIAPAAFRGAGAGSILTPTLWVPLSSMGRLGDMRALKDPADRENRWLLIRARLKPGRTAAAAATELATIGQRLDLSHPIGRTLDRRFQSPPSISRRWHLLPVTSIYGHETIHRFAKPMTWAVVGVLALVLLIACTNLANLTLARSATRRQETAVRRALGASRWRLMRELLMESIMVGAGGGLAALLVARMLMIEVFSTPFDLAPGATLQVTPELDLAVLGAALGATLLAVATFGVIPALQISRVDLRDALATDNAGAAVRRWRGRGNLIALQVFVSVALALIAAVCVQQILAIARRDAGLDLDRLAVVTLNPGLPAPDQARVRQSLQTLLELARRQSNMQAATLASGLPVGSSTRNGYLRFAGAEPRGAPAARNMVKLISAIPGFFDVVGIPLRRGRAFDDRDTSQSVPVMVVNELTARRVFGTDNVIGRQIEIQPQRWVGEPERPPVRRTIVGVAADTDSETVGRRDQGTVYVPFEQYYQPSMSIIARVAGNPAPTVGVLKSLVARVDRTLAVVDEGTGSEVGGASNLPLKIMAGVSGLLGLFALVLAMAGLFGVLTHVVEQRTREMGLRIALGADRGRVMRMVLADGLRPVVVGLLLGVAVAVIVRMAMRPLFVRLLPAADPSTVVVVAMLFVLAAMVACYIPARRAASVDPNVALRHL